MNHLKEFLLGQKSLIAFILFTGIIASILEAIGLSLVIPLLEGFKGQSSSNIPFPFDKLSSLFANVTLGHRIRLVALFMVIAIFLKGVMIYISGMSSCRLQLRLIKFFRMLCFEKLTHIGMGFINNQKKSHLQAITVSLTQNLGSLVKAGGLLIPKIFTIGVLVVMLIIISWKMTLAAFLLIGVASLFLHKISHRAEVAGKGFTRSTKEMNHALLDALLGMKVVRLFSQEQRVERKFEDEVDRFNENYFDLMKAHGAVQPIFETTGIMSLAAILVIGSFVVLQGGANGLEIILVFVVIFFRVLSPALAINQTRVAIRGDMPTYHEVFKFLEAEDDPRFTNGSKLIKSLNQGIEFQNVDFKYDQKQAMILNNISFHVPKGSKFGIVGPSGSGKSTIGELLLRFYDPQKGQILIDGINLKDLDVHQWRRLVGVVSQDIFLFNDTVKVNIAFAKPEATQEEIEQAAHRAYAHDFIKALPQEYDTVVGDRGVLLSGGQKQRIAIARAVLNEPEILLFDEATSALDVQAEEIVQKTLDEISLGKTVITIAHRLSTIVDSDKILIVDKGEILQCGSHQQLLEQKDSLYCKLVAMQNLETQDSLEVS